MTTAHLYKGYKPGQQVAHPTVSFELFPPRSASKLSSIWAGVDRLIAAAPDYVSVTYGASGAKVDTRDTSVRVLTRVLDRHPGLPAVSHLTCVGATRGQLAMTIRLLLRAGIRDFLALRGDPPAGQSEFEVVPGGLASAAELVAPIREIAADTLPDGVGTGPNGAGADSAPNPKNYVSIAVAAYPASSGEYRRNDIAALLEKELAGADYAITQVFYDPNEYASLVRELTIAGGRLPIVPGIIPLTDLKRLNALEKIAGVTVPEEVSRTLQITDARERVAKSLRATLNLIDGVLAAGAPGVHLYTFNRPRPALDVVEYVRASGYRNGRMPKRGEIDTELVDLALHRLTPSN